MHDNVSISKELQETKHMIDNVLLAQGRIKAGSHAGTHADERLSDIASNILSKVAVFALTDFLADIYYATYGYYRNVSSLVVCL